MKMKKLHENLVKNSSWYAKWHSSRLYELTHYIVLILFIVLVASNIASISKVPSTSLTAQARPFEDLNFGQRMKGKRELSGEEAISALGLDIDRVAKHYGRSRQEFEFALRHSKDLKLNGDALLFYSDSELIPQKGALGDGTLPTNPIISDIPDSQTFFLHSKPSATAKIYLDFDGAVIVNTSWNVLGPIDSAPLSVDTDPAFTPAELNIIKSVWRSVAEDYAGFNVDVTTEQPISYDPDHFAKVVISSTSSWYGNGAGGVSFIRSSRLANNQPSFVFSSLLNNSIKNVSEATSHEVGHMLGLYHTAEYDVNCNYIRDYYSGSNSSTGQGWAPIMGVGYYRALTQWTNTSEYPFLSSPYGCNTAEQDDVSIITAPSSYDTGDLRFANDEAGNTVSTAGNLRRTVVNNIATVDHLGILSRGDLDLYKITTLGGDINITVNPMTPVQTNLIGDADFAVRLLDSNMNILSIANPDGVLPATVEALGVPSGTYYLEIVPSGYLDVSQPGGYTTNGSAGQYNVIGSYSSPAGDAISPITSITSPTNGANVSGTLAVSASASDNVGITTVDFYVDSTLIGTDTSQPYKTDWVTNSFSNGTHTLITRAYDAMGNMGVSSLISAIVSNVIPPPPDTTIPTASISSPLDGATISGGSVNIIVSAIDNIKVTKIEIYTDDVLKKSANLASTSFKWQTGKLRAGVHTISVKAYDVAGNVGEKSVSVLK
jgi:hypothetical protein